MSAITNLSSSNVVRGPALSLASQGVGLAQIALLLVPSGANEATDAYFYLFNMALFPTLIMINAVMYPLLINEQRMSQHGLARVRWVTPALGIVFVIVGALWLDRCGRLGPALVPLVGVSAANAIAQPLVWFKAVCAQAAGDTRWIGGIALPANLTAVTFLLLPWSTAGAAVIAMVSGLVVGNLALLVVMTRRGIGDAVFEGAPTTVQRSFSGTVWFFGRGSVSYIGMALMQSTAALLPAASLTILSLATKLVESLTSTFILAILPAIVHQNTQSKAAARQFLRILASAVGAGSVVGVIVVIAVRRDLLIPAVALSLWLLAASLAAVAQRLSFRFLRPSASGITMGGVSAVVACALLSASAPGFDLNVLLSSYAATDAISAMLMLWMLKDRTMSTLGATVLLALSAIWVGSLFT